jgi:hypothetical protein
MNIGDHHPIEPLPERSWDRIKEGVFAELDSIEAGESVVPPRRRRRRWPPVAVAVVAASAAAAATLLFVMPDGSDRALLDRTSLDSTRVVTAETATETSIGDISVHAEPHTALVVVKNDVGGLVVVLEQGAAVFGVPPRHGRPTFLVQGGSVRVEVIGTRFRVERVGASAHVETYEGTVRVLADGRTTLVEAGDRWPANAMAGRPGLREPAVSEPADSQVSSSEANPEPHDLAHEERANRRDREGTSHDLRREFERAASLEATDPAEAVRIYQHLASGGGSWGANALFATGRLQLERGDIATAERRLRHYLDRYPHGANAADARALLDRIRRATQVSQTETER